MQTTDQEILDYEKLVKQDELQKPMISPLEPFTSLLSEYSNNDLISSKIQQLSKTKQGLRLIRKDGNCFYRAFAFKFCELVQKSNSVSKYKEIVEGTIELLVNQGYERDIVQDFKEPLVAALDNLDTFDQDYNFDTIVCYLRILTAAHLKENAQEYEIFVSDRFPSIQEFIASQVEPMNIESDEIHIVCLCKVLKVCCRIYNLDNSEGDINSHLIGDESSGLQLSLLYRPGHYDILYES